MLTTATIKSASESSRYFASRAVQYYSDPEGGSKWVGNLCSTLGVSGVVQEDVLDQYLHGILPDGRQMGRKEGDTIKHRPGYELCFSAPKSVSILALIGDDKRLVDATWEAAESVLSLVEEWYTATRVTKKGETAFIKTREMAAACFMHESSRENDPNMHIHA